MRKRRKRCGECKVWEKGWCKHLAKIVLAGNEACEWCRREARKEYRRNWMRRKKAAEKSKKQEQKKEEGR